MGVRAFTLIGSTDRRRLEAAAVEAVQHWAGQWFCGDAGTVYAAGADLDAKLRASINRQSPLMLGDTDGDWCALVLPEAAQRRFLSAMFGEPGYSALGLSDADSGSLLNTVVGRALTALGRRLLMQDAALDTPPVGAAFERIPARAALEGAGCQVMTLRLGDVELTLVLSADVVRALLSGTDGERKAGASEGRETLVALASVLAHRRVRAEARLGSVELSVAALTSLRTGDVIQLDRSLSEPSALVFPGTAVTCGGVVGRRAGRRALRLVPPIKG